MRYSALLRANMSNYTECLSQTAVVEHVSAASVRGCIVCVRDFAELLPGLTVSQCALCTYDTVLHSFYT